MRGGEWEWQSESKKKRYVPLKKNKKQQLFSRSLLCRDRVQHEALMNFIFH